MDPPNPGEVASAGSSSHAASGGFQETTRQAVYPFIRTDLQYIETCSIHGFLRALLDRCRSDPPNYSVSPVSKPSTPNIPQSNENSSVDDSPNGSDKTEKAETKPAAATPRDSDPSGREPDENDLLEACLQSVLPLCNEDGFRNLIRAYCIVPGHEKQRYPPFTVACNYALRQLRALDVPHLRPPSSCEILFQVNDPLRITGYKESSRSPDIVIISLETAQRIHGPTHDWDYLAKNFCRAPPLTKNFKWSDVLGFAEFKRFNSITLKFPDKFDYSLHEPVPPQMLPDGLELLGPASTPSSLPVSVPTDISKPESNRSQTAAAERGRPSSDTSLPTATGDLLNDVPGATYGTKRSLEGTDSSQRSQGESKKQKGDANQRIQEGIVQCGSYAADMFNSSAARQHILGLFIIDGVVWVWWYDRQGPIQSSGINIPRDLPLFAVLLFCLQRLSRADWGYNLELEPQASSAEAPGTAAGSEPQTTQTAATSPNIKFGEREVSIHLHDMLHEPFHLVGRGTWTFGASCPDWDDIELVAKLSWPNKKRAPEGEIIKKAVAGAPNAKDHLPKVLASCDGYDTEEIRRQLGINQNSKRPFRVFRMTIFERLHRITSVTGLERMAAIVQCVKCHYLVWQAGVQHRDLSLDNLMVRKRKGTHLGVVNDWDLAFADGLSEEVGEHTATLPFLAIGLLVPEYWEGNVPVRYRHDLEAFIWIIHWLAKCSESPGGKPPKDMLEWQTSAMACLKAKSAFLQTFQPSKQSTATIESRVAVSLLRYLYNSDRERGLKIMNETWTEADELSDKSQLEDFLHHVSRALSLQNFQLPPNPVID